MSSKERPEGCYMNTPGFECEFCEFFNGEEYCSCGCENEEYMRYWDSANFDWLNKDKS